MKIINSRTLSNINISALGQVYSFTISETLLIIVDVLLDNIAGGTDYDLNFYTDGAFVLPTRSIPVPVGATKVSIQSRSLIVKAGAVLTLNIQGDVSDTDVDVTVNLINASPVDAADVVEIVEPGITDAITDGLAKTEIRPTRHILAPIKCDPCEDDE